MANSINSSITNANRVSGLASGMDTEEIIKAMLGSQTAKINKQLAAKQTLQWKQEAYRSIISAVSEFQAKYLNKASASSIFNINFLNPMKTMLSAGAEKYVSITAAAGASVENIVIDSITSLATAQRLVSKSEISEPVRMTLGTGWDTADFAGKSIDVVVDGVRKTITLSNITYGSITDVRDEMQSRLTAAFGAGRVTVAVNGNTIEFEPSTGSTMFLEKSAGNPVVNTVNKYFTPGGDQMALGTGWDTADFAGKSFDIVVGGVSTTIMLTDKLYSDINDVRNEMQDRLDDAFGIGIITVGGTGKIIEFSHISSDEISLEESSADPIVNTGNEYFISGKTNRTGLFTKLGDMTEKGGTDPITNSSDVVKFRINGVDFEFNASNTINDVINKVNSSSAGVKMTYSSATDKFTLTSNTLGAGDNIRVEDIDGTFLERMFGKTGLVYGDDDIKYNGANAEFEINGVAMVRNSNSFTIDGVTFNLLAPMSSAEGPITASVTNDIDKAVENIKSYITAYNDLVKLLTFAVNEKGDKNFYPLSDEQKEKMSAKDIEKWEAEAKKGLLYNDSAVTSMIQALRSAMTSPVYNKDGTLLGTFTQIGIRTVGYFEEGGRDGMMTVDEEKLRKALAENPSLVMSMFTQETDIKAGTANAPLSAELSRERFNQMGLAQRFAEIFDSKISTRYMAEGELILIAGGSGNKVRETQTKVAKSLKLIEDYIQRLQAQYERMESRYWKQFSKLETALGQMNSQSAFLFSQFNSN